MALKKQENLFGIQIEAYIKISGVDIREQGEDFEDGSKKYKAITIISYFSDVEKKHLYKQETEEINDLRESELVLPVIYSKVMQMEKFAWSEFI